MFSFFVEVEFGLAKAFRVDCIDCNPVPRRNQEIGDRVKRLPSTGPAPRSSTNHLARITLPSGGGGGVIRTFALVLAELEGNNIQRSTSNVQRNGEGGMACYAGNPNDE